MHLCFRQYLRPQHTARSNAIQTICSTGCSCSVWKIVKNHAEFVIKDHVVLLWEMCWVDGFRTSGTIRNECSLENYHGEPCSPTLVFSCHPAVPGLSRKLDNPRHEHMAIQIQNDELRLRPDFKRTQSVALGGRWLWIQMVYIIYVSEMATFFTWSRKFTREPATGYYGKYYHRNTSL